MKIQLLLIFCGVAQSFLLRNDDPARDTQDVKYAKIGEGKDEVETVVAGKYEYKFVNGYTKGAVKTGDVLPGVHNAMRNIVARASAKGDDKNTEAEEMQNWLRNQLAPAAGVTDLSTVDSLALRPIKNYGHTGGVDFSAADKTAVCGRDWLSQPLPLGTYMWMDSFVLQLTSDSFSYTQSTDTESMLEKIAAFRFNMNKMVTDPKASIEFLIRYFFPDFSRLSYEGFSFAVMYYGGRLPEFQCWLTYMVENKCGGFKPDPADHDRTGKVRSYCEDSGKSAEEVINLFTKEELSWYAMKFPQWSDSDLAKFGPGKAESIWQESDGDAWDFAAAEDAVPESNGLYSMAVAKGIYPKQFACMTLAMIQDGCGNSMYPGGNVKWDSKYNLYAMPYTKLPAVWKDNNKVEWNYYQNSDGVMTYVVDGSKENIVANDNVQRAIAR